MFRFECLPCCNNYYCPLATTDEKSVAPSPQTKKSCLQNTKAIAVSKEMYSSSHLQNPLHARRLTEGTTVSFGPLEIWVSPLSLPRFLLPKHENIL